MQTSQTRMRLHLPQRVRLWMVFTKVKANSSGRPVNNNQRGIDIVFGVVLFFFFFSSSLSQLHIPVSLRYSAKCTILIHHNNTAHLDRQARKF